jgi:enterochelin esterase family protein
MNPYTSNLIKATRTIFPNIDDKDIKAMVYSKPEKEPYSLGEDSKKQEGVPEGTVTKYHLTDSVIYPGTERDYWVYVPKQYDAMKPACLMIFQDGMLYLFDPAMQANIQLDNLIHKKEIPVIIGVFINSGDKGPGMPLWGGTTNRSFEYDSTTDQYSRFLTEEIIPEIKKQYNIVDDPNGTALVGISSGGVAAFNAAWHRPDVFGKVIVHCGSFVSLRGADKFPELIRKTPPKPLKVFLQSGVKDLNVIFGSWAIKNKEMAAAFKYSGYDHKFVFGKGGHSMKHGGAIFPDTLKWLWGETNF